MTYLPLATDMMGTPGTLRIRLFRSRSFAAERVSIARHKASAEHSAFFSSD